eukprot:CAMPEP_0203760398 /NCGR_PEP_ID=MMETSP0098-20131031/13695_1 /ASSEMBLY_ACC=CAM_ASM_000208 /TAXON_ID=96639 /ORGANISM=" , Strain NY0313808BC1" /LENGTH=541 /DNA_ID=CAMNT_0050653933 /DNA_START=421 /DNA_END=2046 /DNA_ORIENTATION=-
MLDVVVRVLGPFIDYVATHYRPLAMMVVVLPLSFLMRLFVLARDYALEHVLVKSTHEEKVRRVVGHVKERLQLPAKDRKFMCTARAPWMNLSTRFADYKKNSSCIFVGDLNNVLELDEENLVVRVEPLVDVGKITRYLVARGYMLATTLEIEEATIGGLAMAVGMTTASHKFGLLQETVVEYEVVTGTGELLSVTKSSHPDLFKAIPWSHGSICLLVSLKLEIIRIKPFVRVDYVPITDGLASYCAKIREVSLAKQPADFVEATIFSKKEAVVMTGRFVSKPDSDGAVNHVGRWYKPWFWVHVRDSVLPVGKDVVEYIPTYEYIFRHNRGVFWTLKDQLPEKYGNNVVFRYVFGWLMPPNVTFLKLPATPAIRREMMLERVYQDIVLPMNVLEESIQVAADLFGIFPLLVYPSRIYDHGSDQGQFRRPKNKVAGEEYGMYYDLGIYGIPAAIEENKPFKTVTSMRKMEAFTRKAGGAPFLYADTFMDFDEFKEMFDLELYDKVRDKYQAVDHFPHLFAKTSGCQSFDWKQLLLEEQSKKVN